MTRGQIHSQQNQQVLHDQLQPGRDPAQIKDVRDRRDRQPATTAAPESATMPLLNGAQPPSFRRASTPSRGRLPPQVRAPRSLNRWRSVPRRATRPRVRRTTSAGHSGDNGAVTTAEAARKRKCDFRETVGPAPHGAGLRPSGRGVPSPCHRSERHHRTRHPCHRDRRISLSGKGETPAFS